jgi:hypothetical protein
MVEKCTVRRKDFKDGDEFHWFLSVVLTEANGKPIGDCDDEDLANISRVTIVVDPYETTVNEAWY